MANVAVSEKSLTVLNFLKEHDGENLTAADIAQALGMEKKSVDGVVTSGLQRKGLTERIPAQIETTDENGNTVTKPIKLIKLTDAGRAYDHEAVTAAYEAEQAAAKSAE